MSRLLFAALLLAPLAASAQPPAAKPTHFPPDAATRQVIVAKAAELKAAVAALDPLWRFTPDVAVYSAAVERALRLDEFPTKDSVKQTLAVLDAGLKRAAAAKGFEPDWPEVRDKPIVRGYFSGVDGSAQPYILTLTTKPQPDPRAPHRLDVILHGRDAALTEIKMIAQAEAAKPGELRDFNTLEIYGRGNNGYRWAGDADIYDAYNNAQGGLVGLYPTVLRGFSMGGAGAWHFGLHHPFVFQVLGPGAGFTATHGYVGKLPDPLPDYQEKCLRIYDAVRVAENVFNIPVVAYSGEKDKQKAAADTIVSALNDFKEPHSLTHLVAAGLEHKMPPEWMAKAEAEYRKHIAVSDKRYTGELPKPPIRYVLFTTAYPYLDRGSNRVTGLERHYDKAVVTVTRDGVDATVVTSNVHSLDFAVGFRKVVIDGQVLRHPSLDNLELGMAVVKTDGKWAVMTSKRHAADLLAKPRKSPGLQGPIDDAFMRPFAVAPAPAGDSPVVASLAASHARFGREWDRNFRGVLPTLTDATPPKTARVIFGTFDSPLVAAALPKLPITWTANTLTVNGVSYDAKTHYPALIYPDPLNRGRYLVLNSGHTFHAAEFEGSNALLYPRLGDWAVLKLAPTKLDPARTETVAAGLFDEDWQFAK